MSEMRRAARALVEIRSERFESLHALEESKARLAAALERARPGASTVLDLAWSSADGRAVLEARFAPPASTQRILRILSAAMALAIVASAWAIVAEDGALAFLLPLFTVLAIFALPFVALGLGSQRAAAEARILKAIRVALRDEAQGRSPRLREEDEAPG